MFFNYVRIFRVSAEIDVIFVEFSRGKTFLNNTSMDTFGENLTDTDDVDEITKVPSDRLESMKIKLKSPRFVIHKDRFFSSSVERK